MRKLIAHAALTMVCITAVATMAMAQTKTATDFYLEYRQAFDKATKVEEIMPYLAKARQEQIQETPAAERADMFELMKMLGVLKDLKIVKETKTAAGYDLEATAVDGDGSPSTGTIHIVMEGKDMKVDKESWASKG
jgi:Na+-translocating ferredoxin:NAD+ oxidoreductase RnfG subunit